MYSKLHLKRCVDQVLFREVAGSDVIQEAFSTEERRANRISRRPVCPHGLRASGQRYKIVQFRLQRLSSHTHDAGVSAKHRVYGIRLQRPQGANERR